MDRSRHFIRDYRITQGKTLDDMVRLLDEQGITTTNASLSRIERNIQPYSQDILEAISVVLGIPTGDLLKVDPLDKRGEVVNYVMRLDQDQALQAEAVLRAIFDRTA